MQRRKFIKKSLYTTLSGYTLLNSSNIWALSQKNSLKSHPVRANSSNIYSLFKTPASTYHPFVRWWWNGNKVEKNEIIRELRLLKEAGVGGVEINPIDFPSTGDDLGIKSIRWLSDEWIDLLQVTFNEAKKLDMTCDLIVGSGWPFGAETLPHDERAQVALMLA